MWLRLSQKYDVGFLAGDIQAYYRVHNKSMSSGYYASQTADLEERWKAFESVLGYMDVGRSTPLSKRVRQALAREALRRARSAYDRGRKGGSSPEELVQFAEWVYPDYHALAAWRGYRLRTLLGPKMSRVVWPFFPAPYLERARSKWWWYSLERRGL